MQNEAEDSGFLSLNFILELQEKSIDLHGGAHGVLNLSSLESALGSVKSKAFYTEMTVIEIAADYGFKLVQSHAFRDGNKRIGAVVMLAFLDQYDIIPDITDDELEATILAVAQGLCSVEALVNWLNSKIPP